MKIVGLPGSQSTDSPSTLSPENIATAMVMYKHVLSGKGVSGSLSNEEIGSLQAQISQLTGNLDDVK